MLIISIKYISLILHKVNEPFSRYYDKLEDIPFSIINDYVPKELTDIILPDVPDVNFNDLKDNIPQLNIINHNLNNNLDVLNSDNQVIIMKIKTLINQLNAEITNLTVSDSDKEKIKQIIFDILLNNQNSVMKIKQVIDNLRLEVNNLKNNITEDEITKLKNIIKTYLA